MEQQRREKQGRRLLPRPPLWAYLGRIGVLGPGLSRIGLEFRQRSCQLGVYDKILR